MKLLLDTHVVVWAALDHPSAAPFRDALKPGANELFVSSVVTWELAIKAGRGKIRLSSSAHDFVTRFRAAFDAVELPVTSVHAGEIERLPDVHGDPFDRMLVAQARAEGLTLATGDPIVRGYPVALFPA